MTGAMRTNSKIGSKIKRKFGKIGFPKSAKRKSFLAKIRPKKKKTAKRKGKRKS